MKVFALLSILTSGLFAYSDIYLSASHLYSPEEKTEINLEAYGIDKVYFRLYKIENPTKFFASQKNLHSPKVRQNKDAVNLFHMIQGISERAKRNSRYLAREMLSEESRISIRDYIGLPNLEKTDKEIRKAVVQGSVPKLKGYPLLKEWTFKFVKKKKSNDDYYSYNNSYHYETVDLGIDEPGVYLVEAYYGTKVAYTPVVVSNISLITKQTPKGVYIFALNSADGKPRKGAKVTVLAGTKTLASGRTNAKGLFHTAVDTSHIKVLLQDGDNFALLDKYYYYDNEDYYYDDYYEDDEGFIPDPKKQTEIKVYLHTERPIYRPDQTVYFKGIIRRFKRGQYRKPSVDEAKVVITDPEGKEIYRQTLKSDDWGAFNDSLIVPTSSRLGKYTLTAYVDSSCHSTYFKVEEYRKPEFKVEVKVAKKAYIQGDIAKITVSADYFFGAPVAKADVKLKVYRRQHHRYYWYGTSYVDELEASTDENGKLVFSYRLPLNDKNFSYIFEAQVRDASRRSESGEARSLVASSEVLVNLTPLSYVVNLGEEAEIEIKTHDILNKPVAGKVDLLVYRDYWDKDDEVVARRTVRISNNGVYIYKFKPKKGGYYYVKATSSDKNGRTNVDKRWFWVSERNGYYTWKVDRTQIVFDKESYKVGDWAEALIIYPFENASVISSIEADDLYDIRITEMKGNTARLKFKVRPEYFPNVYLSVSGIFEGDFFNHSEKMVVNDTSKLLKIELSSDKEKYEPGEKAKFKVFVKDWKNRPVKADISVGLVDEAIYSLASEFASPIKDYFYGERYNQVSTSSSIYFSFYGYEQDYAKLKAATKDSVVLAAYKGKDEPKIRTKFKDMAYWDAILRTNAKGEANFELIWPDNLTTWRATAKAITEDSKVGEVRYKSLVTKDLLIRIIPPRFVTERDSLIIPTVVHNYTHSTQDVKISFLVDGAKLFSKKTSYTATIASGGAFRVDWPVKCETSGKVKMTAKVIGVDASDAMQLTIPANPHGIMRNLLLSGFMPKPEQKITRSFSIPKEIQLSSIQAKLTLTPTISSALFSGLSYLAAYPYGCVEQTMSSFFPDLIVADLIADPKKGNPALAKELPKMIEKGLAKLYGYQHSDGGWGWWENDKTMNIMTAYVVHGLTYAQELGYDINPKVLKRGSSALASLLETRDTTINVTERAYMVYALSMAPGDNKAVVEKHLKILRKKKVDPYAKALMALSYHEIGDDASAKLILKRLKKDAITDEETVYWAGQVRNVEYWYDDPIETTATALRAFLAISPKDEVVSKVVFWLLRKRRGNRWKSTKDSGLALLALAEFLKTTGDTNPNMKLDFTLNGKSIANYNVSANTLSEFNRPLVINLRSIKPTANNILKVHKKGSGNLFFSLILSYYSKEEEIPSAGSALKITREYYRLVPKVENNKLVYDKLPLEGALKVGEPLFVKLYVDADDDYEYVMIKDPLPAGFEVAKNRDRYSIRNERYWWGYYDYEDWGYMYSGRELHDDHTAFFISYLWGHREFSYVLEPYLPGVYHTMPAEASLMYFSDKRAHSAENIITVVEK